MADRIARVWTGSEWEIITSTAAAPNAVIFYQATAPTSPVTGQLWLNTTTNQFNIWNGTAWVAAVTTYTYQSTAPSSPVTGQVWVDSDDRQFYVWNGSAWISAITTFTYQSSQPTSPTIGQVWVDSDDSKIYVWTGSDWATAGGGLPDNDQNILANRIFG